MTRYVAFLRGINVSGQKIIPMTQLKQIFEGMKLSNVATYIQSGNVIFDAKSSDSAKLTALIEKGLATELGYDVPVILRTMRRLVDLLATDRFAGKVIEGKTKPYFAFVKDSPKHVPTAPFLSSKKDVSIVGVEGLDVICLSHPLPNGTWGFPNAIIEKEFGAVATTRNPNTIAKIVAKFG